MGGNGPEREVKSGQRNRENTEGQPEQKEYLKYIYIYIYLELSLEGKKIKQDLVKLQKKKMNKGRQE